MQSGLLNGWMMCYPLSCLSAACLSQRMSHRQWQAARHGVMAQHAALAVGPARAALFWNVCRRSAAVEAQRKLEDFISSFRCPHLL